MGNNIEQAKSKWRGVKATKGFHNAIIFILFIIVASVFWMIVALNDNVTETLDVKLKIVNVPDSVTFIVDPPTDVKVTLRDKGTNILRTGVISDPELEINFRDFANNTVFRFTRSDLNAALKSTFGSSAQIGSVSIDSLYLRYTTGKGKRVPIVVRTDVSASSGNVIAGFPEPQQSYVMVYSLSDGLDTLNRVYTETIVKRNLAETTEVEVNLQKMSNTKFVPSKVRVKIPVEPLVRKEAKAAITAVNVPHGMNVLFFPDNVEVSYYIPMSLFSDEDVPVTISANFEDTHGGTAKKVPVFVRGYEDYVMNPEIMVDSVEYTIVKE